MVCPSSKFVLISFNLILCMLCHLLFSSFHITFFFFFFDDFGHHQHKDVTLTHWGRVTHICVSKLTIIGSDNGLSPGRRHYLNQWWNIVNWTLGNKLRWNFNRNWNIFIQENAFENIVWKMASILSWPQCVKTSQTPISISIYLWNGASGLWICNNSLEM